jgi:tripartite-type tricarboxylate transporter receptor subunit TctC
MRKTPLKNSQFDHLARLCVDPLLLVVPAQSPSTTLDDYLGHMKKTGVAIGANGDFNTTHVLAAMTARSMNARFVYVPYAGGPKILSDLMGGHLESAILKPSDCRSQLEAKTLRPLAVFAKQRLAGFPDVPTLAEKGVDVFGMGPIVQMSYLAAPAGLPAPIKSRLITAVRAALRDPRYAKLAAQNAFVVDDLTGDALTAEVTGVGNAISSIATKVIQ